MTLLALNYEQTCYVVYTCGDRSNAQSRRLAATLYTRQEDTWCVLSHLKSWTSVTVSATENCFSR